ncbi:MAG: alkaline phosphatase family protein [Candidatus Kerfeldbacteria bacterium]
MNRKIVAIGLDGATWKLLKPLADKGYMPTVKKLMEQGVSGDLESTIPNMTATAWTTFATGKHPGKHGVFDFMLPTDSLGNMKFVTSKDIKDKTIYELLHERGLKSILLNLPATWPPKLKDTPTITSLLTQGDQFIYPASLVEEFPELKKWRLTPDESLRITSRQDEYTEDLLNHMEEQVEAVKAIFKKKPWDFFFYLFSHSDWISHMAFKELEEQQAESPRRVFEKIDEHLKWFVDNLPEDANLIVLSDHGFAAFDKIFYLNRWLEQQGYLKTNKQGDDFRGAVTRRAKETDTLRAKKKKLNIGTGAINALSKIPVAERAAKWSYHHIVKKYFPVHIKVNVGIDFNETNVCFPKGAYITNAYINKDWVYTDGTVSSAEYLPLRTEIIDKLRNLKDPQGVPVVKKVMTRDEVYGGDAPDQAPDIFFELDQYWLTGHFHSGSLFGEEVSNKHGKYGVFMAYGPDFETNAEVKNLKMQDITPIILHLFGLPVPSDCDGRVSKALFTEDSDAKKKPVEIGPVSRKQEEKESERDSIKSALGSIKL